MQGQQKGCDSILMRLLAGSQQRVVVGVEEVSAGDTRRETSTRTANRLVAGSQQRVVIGGVMHTRTTKETTKKKAKETKEDRKGMRVYPKKKKTGGERGTSCGRRVLVLGGNPERSVPSNASTFRRGDLHTRTFVPSKAVYNHYKEYHEGGYDGDDDAFEQCTEENPVVHDLSSNGAIWEGQGRIQY